MPTSTKLDTANERRRDDAAERTIAIVARFFEHGDTTGATAAMLETARARLAHPGDSLTQLGDRLGITKDTVSGRLRQIGYLVHDRERRAQAGA